jgi:predicted DNA-binding ribbon-helix-helix protein
MKKTKLTLTQKELNLILSALWVRFEETTENQDTLVGRLTNRLYEERENLRNN